MNAKPHGRAIIGLPTRFEVAIALPTLIIRDAQRVVTTHRAEFLPEEIMFSDGARSYSTAVVRLPPAWRGILLVTGLVLFLGAVPNSGNQLATAEAASLDAFRFLTQASFGPTASELDRIQTL